MMADTAAVRLNALAKAAYRTGVKRGTPEQQDLIWAADPMLRGWFLTATEGLLEVLGFVSASGEVYCPAASAGKAAAEALREMLDSMIERNRVECQAQMDSEKCPECPRDWQCDFAADAKRWRGALDGLEGRDG